MASINSVTLSGNLVRDAEGKQTTAGSPVIDFSMAVNERRKTKSGDWEDYPNYVDCVMYGERGKKILIYLTKGKKVFVKGHLRQQRWEAQDGSKRSKVVVVVDDIDFGSRGAENGSGGLTGAFQQQTLPQSGTQQAQEGFYDNDIPF